MKKQKESVNSILVILLLLNSFLLVLSNFVREPEWLSILMTCLQLLVAACLIVFAIKMIKDRKKDK